MAFREYYRRTDSVSWLTFVTSPAAGPTLYIRVGILRRVLMLGSCNNERSALS